MSVIINIMAFILVFIFIVVVHEFGHYLFAVLFGVKVHEFAIGFGPAIYRRKGKKTDFRINVFPLGGYVRLKGEDPEEQEDPDSLYGVAAWKRFLIVLAGPVFSILAGYLLFVLIISGWGYTPIIIDKVIPGSPAQQAGLQPDDIVLKLNGKHVFDTTDMTSIIRKGKPLTLEVLRNAERITVKVTPALTQKEYFVYLKDVKGDIGGKVESVNNIPFERYMAKYQKEYVTIKSEVGELKGLLDNVSVLPERYAIGIYYGQFSNVFAKDNELFKKGDKLLKVEDMEVQSTNDLMDVVTALGLKPDELYIQFSGDKVTQVLRPLPEMTKVLYESNGTQKEVIVSKEKLLSVLSVPGVLEVKAPKLKPRGLEAISVSVARSNRLALYIWKTLPGVFLGRNLQEVSGPVGVVQVIGQAVQFGLETILTVVAIITINLGIFNLFPLPALDGGRIIFALAEMISRRKINRNVENLIHTVGFFLLLGFLFFMTFVDISRLFTR
ncbi:regulator of sigma E protease [Fervidobacterium changbaicum]|uniref:Site-2 protease family protein n=2 Tax=Fervidobacterium TaxID=2422 RepID=A0AAI8CMH0_FERIS|nr:MULTISPECIES: site-2 protease family protein [Fervidobacterium]AMW32941.1 site-2 protease family protein [Fervidobacterium islandicum]QAV32979.1 PDZ domain-containing protein [Fervidobacterium changbaicum]SDH61110.1 regulator of sigma E protease [Fervidobacterium changbaicum]